MEEVEETGEAGSVSGACPGDGGDDVVFETGDIGSVTMCMLDNRRLLYRVSCAYTDK